MVHKDQENELPHIQDLVFAILPRTGLDLIAKVKRQHEGELKHWIEEAKELLGDRFSWVYQTMS